MNYAYTGRSAAGAVDGVLDGESAARVADQLLGAGITPLTIVPAAGRPTSGWTLPRPDLRQWLLPPVRAEDLLLFSRQLHTLLRAGVPIMQALVGLQESATSERLKQTLQQLRGGLNAGLDLSTSLARHPQVFEGLYVALVRVGESTGRLDEIFLRLFHHLEFELVMRQQIKSALRYPMFVLAAMAIGVAVINVMVIPAFATVFKSFGAELPLATRVLLGASSFSVHYGWTLLLGGAAGGWALRRWIATAAGRLAWDRFKLRLPLAGPIVRKGMLARFARSFALALRSGVPVEQALGIVAQTVDNQHIAQRIEGMRDSVGHGESILRAAAAAQVFTPVVLQMIAVGEQTGALDELLDQVGELYSQEVQYELKTLGQQIEPILIIGLGLLVLVLALGVFLPVWDLGSVALRR
ncbi:type II secretion system F family protein [Aquincola sp. S2]|uniref:Type II secretion system F family protein n=1 Tax=Pseudaquabacterium terrae TaxID=2732868 RepID=A0ABX2EQX4_9BURK|nr:type II secretion system F family protein [Aquabacterium terrae]NRF71117.1 type II secretion system F family protein [Aquabacterium terrae]